MEVSQVGRGQGLVSEVIDSKSRVRPAPKSLDEMELGKDKGV